MVVDDKSDLVAAIGEAFGDEGFIAPEFSKSARIRLAVASILSFFPLVLYLLFLLSVSVFSLYLAVRFFPDFFDSPNSLFIALYFLAVIALLMLFLGLLRPLFSRPFDEVTLLLSEDDHPDIYNYVNAFAELVQVDKVSRILLSMDVAVDVSYSGLRSWREKRLTLTLGLPVIATLTLNEFSALLVHQLAPYHDKKMAGRFALIRWVRAWLYGVVHNEDDFTHRLADLSGKSALITKALAPVYIGLVLVNKLFSVGLDVIEMVTHRALESLQFYADEMQAQVCGSAYFDDLLKKLAQVDQAFHVASEEVLSKKSVPENMADLISEKYARMPAAGDQFIEMARSEYFDNWHLLPPPNVRARRITQFNYAARNVADMALVEVFQNVDKLGVELSALFYKKHQLIVDEKDSRDKTDSNSPRTITQPKEEEILKRVTSGLFRRDVVWEFPQADKFTHVPEEKITPFLNKLVVSIRHSLPDLTRYMDLVADYDKHMARLHLAKWLIKDGSRQRPSVEEVDELNFYKKDFEKAFSGKREFYRKSYGVRVAAAVALGKSSKAYGSAVSLIKLLSRLSTIQDSVYETKIKGATLAALLAKQAEGATVHRNTISRLTRMVLKLVGDIERVLEGLPLGFLPEGTDPKANKLDLECLNGADYERLVLERFLELVSYYEAYNTAMSAKLGQFVEMVENKKGIESVVIAAARQGATASRGTDDKA